MRHLFRNRQLVGMGIAAFSLGVLSGGLATFLYTESSEEDWYFRQQAHDAGIRGLYLELIEQERTTDLKWLLEREIRDSLIRADQHAHAYDSNSSGRYGADSIDRLSRYAQRQNWSDADQRRVARIQAVFKDE